MEIVQMDPDEEKFFESRGEHEVKEEGPSTEPETVTTVTTAPDTPSEPAKTETKPAEPGDKLKEINDNLNRALTEQRYSAKQLKEEIERERQKAKELQETFQKFVGRFGETKKPDFTDDPASHLKSETEELRKELAEQKKWTEEQRNAATRQSEIERFRSAVATREAEFVKTAPDYQDAIDFMRELRRADLTDLGIQPEQIAQALQNEAMTIAANAMRAGKNPAEVAYSIAKRYGYKAKAEKQSPQEKIEQIKKGQEAAKTTPGGSRDSEITLEALANLSDSEIDQLVQDDKWWKKNITSQHRNRH